MLSSSLKTVLEVVAFTNGFRPELVDFDFTDDDQYKAIVTLTKIGTELF